MSPEPPSPSENQPIAPRHRPSLSSFAKDTTELDLWAFDDDLDAPEEETISTPPSPRAKDLPAPRERQDVRTAAGETASSERVPEQDQIRINVNQAHNRRSHDPAPAARPFGQDLDDIEVWDEPPEPLEEVAPTPVVVAPEPQAITSAENLSNNLTPPATPPAAAEAAEDDMAKAPVVPPVTFSTLRSRWKITAIERLGLLMLFVLLLAVGGVVFVLSLKQLPKETERANVHDFPLTGKYLTISAATTYWRAPTASDTVRRGTQLLPVLQLTGRGGPAAIRVLFRNEDRILVGDTVTRVMHDGETMQIPATAGFDDLGMHAAYRTGQSKPWVVEVLEAATADAPGSSFKLLFEMNISTDRR